MRNLICLTAFVALAPLAGMAHAQHSRGTGPMHEAMHGAAGHGSMAGPVGMLTKQDTASAADLSIVMDMVHANTAIRRNVTNLPDGIRTVTESDDPAIAAKIKAHVASMSARLADGREFNIFSTTLPVLFDNASKIVSKVEMTEKGVTVTRTSSDAKVVAALQAHAGEVTELVKEGPVAMHRGMSSRMAMGPSGPRGMMNAPGRQAK